MAKQEIAKYNEDIEDTCKYSKEAGSTVNHIRWHCKRFDSHRQEQDHELAAAPYTSLLHCTQCGIAPAMKANGDRTYWGADFDEDPDEKRRSSWVRIWNCTKAEKMQMKRREEK